MDVFLYSKLLALATVCAHIFLVVFLLLHYSKVSFLQKIIAPIRRLLSRYGLLCAWGVAVAATITPLIYTHIYHLLPCTLCWYQRIFMFPLVIILFLILKRKDIRNKIYVYTLATIGAGIGIYHYVNQQLYSRYNISTTDCEAIGMAKSCSEYYFIEFGYITIPLMALTGFLLVIFFTYFAQRSTTEES
ncbi:MAG: disulfide bond formation protein B [Candidatus Kaiserbacteria bacterium]|nr:disulfide bond formation protein B [Candidatus Kaiserbacteria bacterium]